MGRLKATYRFNSWHSCSMVLPPNTNESRNHSLFKTSRTSISNIPGPRALPTHAFDATMPPCCVKNLPEAIWLNNLSIYCRI